MIFWKTSNFITPWKRPVSAIMSRWPVGQKRAFEIAGAGRVGEDDERRRQRNDGFQRRAADEIDAGFEPGFHGVSCKGPPQVLQDIG